MYIKQLLQVYETLYSQEPLMILTRLVAYNQNCFTTMLHGVTEQVWETLYGPWLGNSEPVNYSKHNKMTIKQRKRN